MEINRERLVFALRELEGLGVVIPKEVYGVIDDLAHEELEKMADALVEKAKQLPN